MFWEKGVFEILQDLQENTCARVSFLMKLQGLACTFIKKETSAPVSFAKFLGKPFLKNIDDLGASRHGK